MDLHANAKLGLAGRRELGASRSSRGAVVEARPRPRFSVSPATAHRWWHRWLDGGRATAGAGRSLVAAASRSRAG